jgi:hypothetical protein
MQTLPTIYRGEAKRRKKEPGPRDDACHSYEQRVNADGRHAPPALEQARWRGAHQGDGLETRLTGFENDPRPGQQL